MAAPAKGKKPRTLEEVETQIEAFSAKVQATVEKWRAEMTPQERARADKEVTELAAQRGKLRPKR